METKTSNETETANDANTVLADSKNLCGWASVAEGMPECGHYIAAYYNPSDSSKKLYVITAWRGRDGWYWDNAEKERAEDKTLKITHWMPMPEPPSVWG